MKCEDVIRTLECPGQDARDELAAAEAHVAECASCRDALYARDLLRIEGTQATPAPDPLLFARVMRNAAQQASLPARSGHRGFWLGTVVGGALAAAAAIAIVNLTGVGAPPVSGALPEIRLAPNETRSVSISLDSPHALTRAHVSVLLNGEIGLIGFDGQKQLTWYTDLDAGANRLTLPIVALGSNGGQLVVEVEHEHRRRTFVIDVRGV